MKKFELREFLSDWDWAEFGITAFLTFAAMTLLTFIGALVVVLTMRVGLWVPIGIFGFAMLAIIAYAVVWYLEINI